MPRFVDAIEGISIIATQERTVKTGFSDAFFRPAAGDGERVDVGRHRHQQDGHRPAARRREEEDRDRKAEKR